MLSHPEWAGLVDPVLVNNGGSAAGLPTCSDLTGMTILQDSLDQTMWNGLSASSYTLLIFDAQGHLAYKKSPANFPADDALVEQEVTALLE